MKERKIEKEKIINEPFNKFWRCEIIWKTIVLLEKNEPIKSMYFILNLFSMLGWVLLLKLLVG